MLPFGRRRPGAFTDRDRTTFSRHSPLGCPASMYAPLRLAATWNPAGSTPPLQQPTTTRPLCRETKNRARHDRCILFAYMLSIRRNMGMWMLANYGPDCGENPMPHARLEKEKRPGLDPPGRQSALTKPAALFVVERPVLEVIDRARLPGTELVV